jgi:hypothetical protein
LAALQVKWWCELHSKDKDVYCWNSKPGDICYALSHSNLGYWAMEIVCSIILYLSCEGYLIVSRWQRMPTLRPNHLYCASTTPDHTDDQLRTLGPNRHMMLDFNSLFQADTIMLIRTLCRPCPCQCSTIKRLDKIQAATLF